MQDNPFEYTRFGRRLSGWEAMVARCRDYADTFEFTALHHQDCAGCQEFWEDQAREMEGAARFAEGVRRRVAGWEARAAYCDPDHPPLDLGPMPAPRDEPFFENAIPRWQQRGVAWGIKPTRDER